MLVSLTVPLSAIVVTYLGPNRTLHELRDFANQGGLDPLRQFSEACRSELDRFSDRGVTP